MNERFDINNGNNDITKANITNLVGVINSWTITDEHKSFFLSASAFYKFFAEKTVITEHDLIISSSFVYSWMPTIFHFRSDKFEQCCGLLKKAKADKDLTKKDLAALGALINNSIIGTSKLLHVINPEVYPIWDSRVAMCFGIVSGVNNVGNYMLYRGWCKNALRVDEKKAILKAMQEKLGNNNINHDNITHIRALEFALFIRGN